MQSFAIQAVSCLTPVGVTRKETQLVKFNQLRFCFKRVAPPMHHELNHPLSIITFSSVIIGHKSHFREFDYCICCM